MLLLVSILLMTSCVSTSKTVVIHDVPDVTFPTFPDPDPVSVDMTTGVVSMPLWFYEKIGEYKVNVDKIEAYMDELRKLNENTK